MLSGDISDFSMFQPQQHFTNLAPGAMSGNSKNQTGRRKCFGTYTLDIPEFIKNGDRFSPVCKSGKYSWCIAKSRSGYGKHYIPNIGLPFFYVSLNLFTDILSHEIKAHGFASDTRSCTFPLKNMEIFTQSAAGQLEERRRFSVRNTEN
jgi:hypothetical protein